MGGSPHSIRWKFRENNFDLIFEPFPNPILLTNVSLLY